MKNVLLCTTFLALSATASLAADLPSRVAPPVYVEPVPVFSWTGVEFGLHSTYSFSSSNRVTTTRNGTPAGDIRPANVTTNKDRFATVGGGLAYNYQFNPGNSFVIGAALDADLVDARKDTFIFPNPVSDFHNRLGTLTTVNGRVGYALGRLLVYGTGGFAFGDVGVGGRFLGGPNAAILYSGGNGGQLKGGYDFGGGVEYALPEGGFLDKFAFDKILLEKIFNIHTASVLKVEYIHYNLGDTNVNLTATGIGGSRGSYTLRYHTEGNQIRAGLVYLLGTAPAPVVARY